MPSMADAFLRLRVDSSQVQKDTQSGLDSVDTKTAGTKGGKDYSTGFTAQIRSLLPKQMTGLFSGKAGEEGSKSGQSFSSALKSELTRAFQGFSLSALLGGGGEGENGVTKTVNGGGLLGGLLPGISGLSAVKASIIGIGGAAVAALPSVVALQAGFIGITAGVKAVDLGIKTLIGTKNDTGPLYAQAQQIAATYQSVMQKAATAMLAPLKSIFNQIPVLLNQLEPAIASAFSGAATLLGPLLSGLTNIAKTVLPQLGGAFRAVSPLIKPLTDGLTSLVAGILPPMVTLIKAAVPVFQVFAGFLGTLGKNIGALFTAFAPVLGQSNLVLGALLSVLNALIPVITSLATSLARTLGPVFAAFAGAIAAVLPALAKVGGVIASLAAAVLTDLSGVFGALGQLIQDLAPSLNVLASTLSTVFGLLENSGIFATLGDAVENVVPLIAQLVNVLVLGLAPAFPTIIQAFTVMATVLTQNLTTALTQLLTAITPVVALIAQATASAVNWLAATGKLVPVLTALLIAWKGWGLAVAAVRLAMVAFGVVMTVVNALLDYQTIALKALYIWEGLVTAATKAWAVVQAALDLVMDANPISLVVIAIAALVAGLVIAWEKSSAFRDALIGAWSAIKSAYAAVASFFSGVADSIIGEFNRIITFVTSSFDTWWVTNGTAIKEIWAALWTGIQAVFTPVWAVIQVAIQVGWGLIQAAFTVYVKLISAAWSTFWGLLQVTASTAWGIIEQITAAAWATVELIFSTAWTVISQAWNVAWAVLKAAATIFWATIEAAVKVAWDVITGLFGVAINLLTGNWSAAWTDLKNIFVQVWNAIESLLGTYLTAIRSVISAAWTAVETVTKTVFDAIGSFFATWWSALKNSFLIAVNGIASALGVVWNGISSAAQAVFKGLESALGTIWGGIKAVLEAPITAVVTAVLNPFIGGIDTVLSWVGIPGIPKIPGFAAGGRIRNMAAGGRLPGYGGGDRRMIMAEDGETVVSKQTSRTMAPLFSAFGVPGYATGGIVGDILGSIPGVSSLATGALDVAKFISAPVVSALNTIAGAASAVGNAVGSGNWPGVIGDVAKKAVTAPVEKIEGLVKDKILGPVTSFISSLLAPAPGAPGQSISPSTASAQNYARGLVTDMWPNSAATNYASLVTLWNGESGWNYQATNPTSGAYGIPQALPADKMASAGSDWKTNAATQIRWGLGYIQSVYGSPTAALDAWEGRNPHWYRKGGKVSPGGGVWRKYSNGGGIPEPVFGLGANSGAGYEFHAGEEVASSAALAMSAKKLADIEAAVNRLNDTTAGVPAGVGRHVGGAIGASTQDAAFHARYPKNGW
jgi:phage-related protein